MDVLKKIYGSILQDLLPITSPLQVLGWIIFLVVHAIWLILFLCTMDHVLNYAWRERKLGKGTVRRTKSKWNEPETSADSEGYVYESPGHMSYELIIECDGWTASAYVSLHQFQRYPENSTITFEYMLGRIHNQPKITKVFG